MSSVTIRVIRIKEISRAAYTFLSFLDTTLEVIKYAFRANSEKS